MLTGMRPLMTTLTGLDVYWLEQVVADMPADTNWLGSGEALCLSNLRVAKRRADWLLGRWTAKRALAVFLNLADDLGSLAGIEICAAPSGAPEAFVAHRPLAVTISLSHSSGKALCVLAPGTAALGCDVERIEPRSQGFVDDYFTSQEQALIEQSSALDRSTLETLLWSGKESTLKALHCGLRLDTRSVIVEPEDMPCRLGDWHPLRVRYIEHCGVFQGWWKVADDFVRTLVSSPQSNEPVLLQTLDCHSGRRKEVAACAGERRAS